MTIDAKMFRRRTNAKGRFIPMTKSQGLSCPFEPRDGKIAIIIKQPGDCRPL